MSAPRFQVATCEGFAIKDNLATGYGNRHGAGLSATVCDTWRLWKEIKTYRSEERVPLRGAGGYRGRAGALQDATDHAEYLNRLYGGD